MSDYIQDKETLKKYCSIKYEELLNQTVTFTISERGAGRKKAEEKQHD